MLDYNKSEEEILKFWKEKKIFEKLREKNYGKNKWSFIDGPITANNPMGVHHAWGRTYKDLYHRFKAMQGHEIRYQNGFDCQGLWVEREEEKDLGLKNKEDIEKFGIKNFVESCKKRVEKFSKIQAQQSIRLGYWMDWENSYYTNSDTNNLHNWFLLKEYHKKGMIFKGKDAVPWCWRCGTASSKHDIATEGYKEVSHTAVYLQFPLKEKPDEYFIIWTTTPWTIPVNVAIAVNKDVDYVLVENDGMKYWLAEKRLDELEGEYKILEKKKGRELEGIKYVMPYANLEKQKNSPHAVISWELASEEDGTGIVHIAPGCGAEDFQLGNEKNLPAISPLDDSGVYKQGFEQFSMKKYSDVNKEVLEDLEQRRFVYKTSEIKHRYPHCWRCSNELVFRLVDEWYIKCTEDFRKKLKKENEKIMWYPEYGKLRQAAWFDNMGDWMISQKRYYGQPLPIWECECGHFEVIGSLDELEEKSVEEDKNKVKKIISIHRPYVDDIKISCPKCSKKIKRIPDLGMAWLDAGIVGFSTIGPYLENKEYWKKWYPADLISENMPGQYRGWFNAMFWAGVALSGKAPFKSLFGYETLKDEKGQEMHKSKGNAIWFDEAVEKMGADPMRLLYCLQDPAQELRFGFKTIKEPQANLNILYNLSKLIKLGEKTKEETIEDRWIVSKYNTLVKDVTNELEQLHPHKAIREIQNFWLNTLSRNYIQFVRERINSEDDSVKRTFHKIYVGILKLASPFIPFITEKIWQELRNGGFVKEESVHLTDWPKENKKLIYKKLEKNFETSLKLIEKGLSERDKEKIGLRWPLARAEISAEKETIKNLLACEGIIKTQLNVKELNYKEKEVLEIKLDTRLTPELEAEGFSREIARKIQAERKKQGLKKTDLIRLKINAEKKLLDYFKKNKKPLIDRTNSKEIKFLNISDEEAKIVEIKGNKVKFSFENIDDKKQFGKDLNTKRH